MATTLVWPYELLRRVAFAVQEVENAAVLAIEKKAHALEYRHQKSLQTARRRLEYDVAPWCEPTSVSQPASSDHSIIFRPSFLISAAS